MLCCRFGEVSLRVDRFLGLGWRMRGWDVCNIGLKLICEGRVCSGLALLCHICTSEYESRFEMGGSLYGHPCAVGINMYHRRLRDENSVYKS